MDLETWEGVCSFINYYVKPDVGDEAVVVYTPDSREAAAWISLALGQLSIPCQLVWMAPIRDPGIGERLNQALPKPDALIGRLLFLSFERDTFSHDRVVVDLLSKFDPKRVVIFRAISACKELFSTTLMARPEEIEQLNATLLRAMMPSKKLRIETAGGSKIEVELDNSRHGWVSNRGIARPGRTVVLPPGEVATYPANISGIFVADFAFNLNAVTRMDTRLSDTPVYVTLADGRAVDYTCENREIGNFLDQCFSRYCAHNVGELGFGTNRRVVSPLAMNSHINERRPGVHLGFGQHNQAPGVVHYQCDLHLDLVAVGGQLWIDDAVHPIDLSSFQATCQIHPDEFRDEDVFSPNMDDLEVEDCCGILRQGEMKMFTLQE